MNPSLPKSSLRTQAAQFALLRRLAPSLRHRLMGGLHPIVLFAELAGRQLDADPPDLASARASIARIRSHARGATTASIATLAWITGEEESRGVALNEGAEACVALLRTDFELRGVSICSRLAEIDAMVSRRALRTVLAASLIAAADIAAQPTGIELRAELEPEAVRLRIETQPSEPGRSRAFAGDDRPLSWEDLEILAKLERIEVRRTDQPLVILCRFPLLDPVQGQDSPRTRVEAPNS